MIQQADYGLASCKEVVLLSMFSMSIALVAWLLCAPAFVGPLVQAPEVASAAHSAASQVPEIASSVALADLKKTEEMTGFNEDVLEDEVDWDEATRRVEEGVKPPSSNHRALCECGRGTEMSCRRPLHRYARLPTYQTFLMCSPTKVYIHREYDYLDYETGEVQVQEVPKRVIHERRSALEAEAACTKAARQVYSELQKLAPEVAQEEAKLVDVEHNRWDSGNVLSGAKGALALIDGCQHVLAAQPSLTEVEVPCKIFGDIHGQLRDLLLLCGSSGSTPSACRSPDNEKDSSLPSERPESTGPGTQDCPRCVFNGDFVDRGKCRPELWHQVETALVLFALKVLFPTQVFLNRGNHEASVDPEHRSIDVRRQDSTMNEKSFCNLSLAKLDTESMLPAFSRAFQYLPFVRAPGDTPAKNGALAGALCPRGSLACGLGTVALAKLDDVRKVQRPLNHNQLQAPENRVLWHASARSKIAVRFGLGLDVQRHRQSTSIAESRFDVMHNESLVRVFSARDYEGNHNDGAVLQVENEDDSGHLGVRPQAPPALDQVLVEPGGTGPPRLRAFPPPSERLREGKNPQPVRGRMLGLREKCPQAVANICPLDPVETQTSAAADSLRSQAPAP
ncbi:Serine/threonine-protein phosphatase PP-Z1 [Symbiodinium microadriaticum]|uniref:Serine/threonine-protein phosphatase n=1 Tax=Symbiodinium microadriaticum TaxID=2951 RepID=A0A1Q9DT71_SYMMI|nr:Serine/threonine-protein phosphatase PP-Z1 [Symbiodinium microadriaticum]